MRDTRHFAFLMASLNDAAAAEDAGASIRASMDAVRLSGILDEIRPEPLCRTLIAVAEANLPVARLVEGHVNVLHLLRRHAPHAIPEGGLLGVWGADGDVPLSSADDILRGAKRYASGLGVVTHALVTVTHGGAVRLALVGVGDTARHRPGTWAMSGMRATASGDIDLSGLSPRWIGAPGIYHEEPDFVGGVWRIAALQLGGTLGLLGAARDHLAERDRMEAPSQIARLSRPLARAMAAQGLVARAATVAHGPRGAADPDLAVALSIEARLLTEDLAQDAIAAVERAVGLPHFADGAPTGRIARDLATYCRQAARDAMEQRAGHILLSRPGPLSETWHG